MLTLLVICVMAALVVTASGLAIQDWKRDMSRSGGPEGAGSAPPVAPPESL